MKSATFKKYKLSAYAATAAILVSNDALAQVVYQTLILTLKLAVIYSPLI